MSGGVSAGGNGTGGGFWLCANVAGNRCGNGQGGTMGVRIGAWPLPAHGESADGVSATVGGVNAVNGIVNAGAITVTCGKGAARSASGNASPS